MCSTKHIFFIFYPKYKYSLQSTWNVIECAQHNKIRPSSIHGVKRQEIKSNEGSIFISVGIGSGVLLGMGNFINPMVFLKAQIYNSRGILVILDVQGYIGNFESVRGIWVILSI